MNPPVSIIIPVYNQAEKLEFLLFSIFQQTFNKNIEILVCDDGSDDAIQDVIHNPLIKNRIRYFRQEHQKFRAGQARNMGIFNATGDILIFLDADLIIEPNLVYRHYQMHRKNKNDVVVLGCRDNYDKVELKSEYLHKDIKTVIKNIKPGVMERDMRLRVLKHYLKDINRFPYPFMMVWSFNMSVKRKHLIELGGFDESFVGYGSEDIELGYRLEQKGLKFIFDTKAICYHKYHKHSHEEYCSILDKNLQIYQKHRNSYVAEGLILGENELVYREYKRDLEKIIHYVENK